MFTEVEKFVSEWEKEAKRTEDVLDRLTDESLGQPVTEGRRTLGDIAWHLVESFHYMSYLGLDIGAPDKGQRGTAKGIAEEYRRMNGIFLNAVKTQWNDEALRQEQDVGGEIWNNGASLAFTMMHQAHHRGQMTVLMRQAGLRPPGVYGQAYEDWIDQGKTPMA
ncbi:DinB family protein [Cohnella caldifontis]|uniref:DinB family protein n=1 Tax=Cohnella caldifontis TaxID=3027471 RepID=UPI0023EC5E0C|nr:DinB family protein [Cohnella sp. YIM B05605]